MVLPFPIAIAAMASAPALVPPPNHKCVQALTVAAPRPLSQLLLGPEVEG